LADILSIVAVHGLAANPHRTWTWRQPSVSEHRGNSYDTGESSDTQINWLQDLLPASVAKARIFAFNYASDWVRDAPMEDLRNVATKLLTMLHDNRDDRQQDKEKPLIFIAHSFGGLVVQEVKPS
jgi:hypothetical protein